MSPIEREIVRRKLERIVENLRLLEPFRELPLDAYRADVYRRKAVERILQEIVEAAVDINSHLLVGVGRPAPEDHRGSFIECGEVGILDPALAATLAPSAGLRNRLVHAYDRIDDALVLAAVAEALDQYPRYVARIEGYISAAS